MPVGVCDPWDRSSSWCDARRRREDHERPVFQILSSFFTYSWEPPSQWKIGRVGTRRLLPREAERG